MSSKKCRAIVIVAVGAVGSIALAEGEVPLYETDLSGATVLTLYLLPEVNLRLRAPTSVQST